MSATTGSVVVSSGMPRLRLHGVLTPLLLGLAPYRQRRRILTVLRSAGAIERAEPLRHDALAAELAGLLMDDLAVADVVLVERDVAGRLAQ
jgi:hypothetical protein